MAKRIQRKRTKGWKMPEGATYVGRPSAFGNPFVAGIHFDQQHAVDLFTLCTRQFPIDQRDLNRWRDAGGFTADLIGIAGGTLLKQLRGRDLACWCDLDQPCHADVLLKLANAPFTATESNAK